MTNTIATKKILLTLFICVFVFSLWTPSARAQVYYGNYVPQTQLELIAYLHGIIAQLQAMLASNGQFFSRTPSVLGASIFRGQFYNVSVSTETARNIREEEADLRGTVRLNGAPNATVWFEYGEDRDMDDRSSKRTIRSSGKFTIEVDDLREGEQYYFRTIAEDPSGRRSFGNIRIFVTDERSRILRRRSSRNDDEPDATTERARNIDEDSAELRGEVDMNDFRNGLVFFVYGEDEDDIEDVDREDTFSDIRERGDDLQKIRVDRDLDRREDYRRRVSGLDDDTEHFFRICVEFEDEDRDDKLECGRVLDFETDRD